jgi:hypothetical protein
LVKPAWLSGPWPSQRSYFAWLLLEHTLPFLIEYKVSTVFVGGKSGLGIVGTWSVRSLLPGKNPCCPRRSCRRSSLCRKYANNHKNSKKGAGRHVHTA